ncbi:MAG: hypothetical protein KBH14_08125, partial [Vicinamibacteria bacterium]|nr:hypothetical protein [Vicinamibacteria bacterium]
MRQATLLMGLWMFSVAKVEAQGGDAVWNRLEVVTRLDNEGLARVEEKHELAIQGDVAVITRGFNFAADQSAVVHGIFRVGPDGSKQALKDGLLSETDSYQTYAWGVQFSLRGDNDPPFEPTVRRYAIEYTLVGAITPAWDVAAGPLPLDDRTTPRNPLTRAMEVLTDWREAWPEPTKSYRLEHDVLLPSRSSTGDMAPFDYRLEYGTAWVLKDKDRPIGVTTPDVDYRVQRVLQYLPPGQPREANRRNAAWRVGALAAPLLLGLALCLAFVAIDRLRNPPPTGSRALFESRVANLPPELIDTHLGHWRGARAPSFERVLLRMAARKQIAINVDTPEREDNDARVTLRLTAERGKLSPFERAIVDEVFYRGDMISTDDIKARFKGREFVANDLVTQAFEGLLPKKVGRKRPLWAALHLAFMGAGIGLMVKSLLEHSTPDPAALFASLVAGNAIVSIWPVGSSSRRAPPGSILTVVALLGLLGTAIALTPNTPLGGMGALGLAILSVGHVAGYLTRLPKSLPVDLEFEAARHWALAELRRPRPALRDAWIESLEALGASRAIKNWKKRREGALSAAPDMSE